MTSFMSEPFCFFSNPLTADGTSKETLRSLTGSNISGWKFQDSFYGNFNLGRRPSMDTAWGRRIYDQVRVGIEILNFFSSKLQSLKLQSLKLQSSNLRSGPK
jgi:hypothetical protein